MNKRDNDRLISVVVPVYNSENTIRRCVESIESQTYRLFEIILVDDGSNDMSGAICDSLSKEYKNIKVFHINNSGAGNARNVGLKESAGDFVTFVDSDDYVDNGFFENAILKIGSNDLYISGINVIYKEKNASFFSKIVGTVSTKELLGSLWNKTPDILVCGPCCKLFRKSIINSSSALFDEKMRCGEDTIFNLKYLQSCDNCYLDNECFYYYDKTNESSLFGNYYPNYYYDHKKVFNAWIGVLSFFNSNSETIYLLKKTYISNLLHGIYLTFIQHFDRELKIKMIENVANDEVVSNSKDVKFRKFNALIVFCLRHKMTTIIFLLCSIKKWGY